MQHDPHRRGAGISRRPHAGAGGAPRSRVGEESRISNLVRWNAAVMVSDGNRRAAGVPRRWVALSGPEVGGHIGTFASICDIYEACRKRVQESLTAESRVKAAKQHSCRKKDSHTPACGAVVRPPGWALLRMGQQ